MAFRTYHIPQGPDNPLLKELKGKKIADLHQISINELVTMCEKRGLNPVGHKNDIVERLLEWKHSFHQGPAPETPRLRERNSVSDELRTKLGVNSLNTTFEDEESMVGMVSRLSFDKNKVNESSPKLDYSSPIPMSTEAHLGSAHSSTSTVPTSNPTPSSYRSINNEKGDANSNATYELNQQYNMPSLNNIPSIPEHWQSASSIIDQYIHTAEPNQHNGVMHTTPPVQTFISTENVIFNTSYQYQASPTQIYENGQTLRNAKHMSPPVQTFAPSGNMLVNTDYQYQTPTAHIYDNQQTVGHPQHMSPQHYYPTPQANFYPPQGIQTQNSTNFSPTDHQGYVTTPFQHQSETPSVQPPSYQSPPLYMSSVAPIPAANNNKIKHKQRPIDKTLHEASLGYEYEPTQLIKQQSEPQMNNFDTFRGYHSPPQVPWPNPPTFPPGIPGPQHLPTPQAQIQHQPQAQFHAQHQQQIQTQYQPHAQIQAQRQSQVQTQTPHFQPYGANYDPNYGSIGVAPRHGNNGEMDETSIEDRKRVRELSKGGSGRGNRTIQRSEEPNHQRENTNPEVQYKPNQLLTKETIEDFLLNGPGKGLCQIKFEDLVFGRKLGSGGYKECYAGTFKGDPVAIGELKVVEFTPEDFQEIKNEIDVLKQMWHECVVRFIGITKGPVRLSIVTELCHHGDLYDHIRANPKPHLQRQLGLMHDIALGVAYLHTRRPSIIHRDLKSMNILLSEDYRAKINDFGLARIRKRVKSLAQTQCGTINWQAPEIWKNDTNGYTEKVDVYAVGLIYWEILQWGEEPFPYWNLAEGDIMSQVGHFHVRPNLAKLKGYPSGLLGLIQKMWQHDPKLRPSMNSVVDELNQYLE